MLLFLLIGASLAKEEETWIKGDVNNPTVKWDWGELYDPVYCPNGYYAIGILLQVDLMGDSGVKGLDGKSDHDDQGVSAAKLLCKDIRSGKTIPVGNEGIGEWFTLLCPDDHYINGYKHKSEKHVVGDHFDDTAVNDISITCTRNGIDSTEELFFKRPPRWAAWGSWNNYVKCPFGKAVIGIQNQLDLKHPRDNAGLVQTRMLCSPLMGRNKIKNINGMWRIEMSANTGVRFEIEVGLVRTDGTSTTKTSSAEYGFSQTVNFGISGPLGKLFQFEAGLEVGFQQNIANAMEETVSTSITQSKVEKYFFECRDRGPNSGMENAYQWVARTVLESGEAGPISKTHRFICVTDGVIPICHPDDCVDGDRCDVCKSGMEKEWPATNPAPTPQGPAPSGLRCGKDWFDADENCHTNCVSDNDCEEHQTCFSYLNLNSCNKVSSTSNKVSSPTFLKSFQMESSDHTPAVVGAVEKAGEGSDKETLTINLTANFRRFIAQTGTSAIRLAPHLVVVGFVVLGLAVLGLYCATKRPLFSGDYDELIDA